MNLFKQIFIILITITLFQKNLMADTIYYLDFKYVLNQSVAGKGAQDFLKKKLSDGIKKLQQSEKKIQDNEKEIIKKKKIISPEEYKKAVSGLRKEVSQLQSQRNKLLDDVAKQRKKGRSELLKNLNPIIKDYMKEKKIRMVIDKKSLLLADENLNITEDVIKILNSKLKSIKLN